jgi:hypothetical protein
MPNKGGSMQRTILTCDRCKKEVPKLCEVAAGMRHQSYSGYVGRSIDIASPLHMEWCEVCCVEMGFQEWKQPPAPLVETLPKLEAAVRELVREELENLKG